MRRHWYAYDGTGSDKDITNYILVDFDPHFVCFGGSTTCTVYSPANAINPNMPAVLSRNLLRYLVTGKALFDKFPNDGIQKPYIYTRPLS